VLSQGRAFSPHEDESFFEQLPAAAAVFVLRGDGEPYVSKTANLRRRLQRLLGPATEGKRLNLRSRVRAIEFTATGSDFESQFLLYQTLREMFPKTYAARLRLRPAPLIKLHLENDYPRASVTTRLGRIDVRQGCGEAGAAHQNLYYGPFPSRIAAEKFASDALDFFKMRRCVEDLQPDPSFPGCVYSEMKMCLAPCFKGCTDADYHAEVARVQAFFDSSGDSLAREFTLQRERSSSELAFEDAASIHAKLEKLKPLLSQLPEIVKRIDRLRATIIQPSAEPDSVALFRFSHACLSGPLQFRIEQSGSPQSMESRVQQVLEGFAARDYSTSERSEHLAMLKRWYYRSQRTGEIFFAGEDGSWPLRRMVRGIGRVHRGEKVPEASGFFATLVQSPTS
jgi:excinuclease UvrABC nuclease subunit